MNLSKKKAVICMIACYMLWGFQPLFWQLDESFDAMFLLASRAVSAGVWCLGLLFLSGRLSTLRSVFSTPKLMLREVFAALFLMGDWFVFLWAVRNAKVMEASVGYYIQPLVVFVFGAVLFREKLKRFHYLALGVIGLGVALLAFALGHLPWVSICLALLFAVYAAIKKSLTIDSLISTSLEIFLMVPFMLGYLLFSKQTVSLDFGKLLFLIGAGAVTAAPMFLYAISISNLPLSLVGLSQYISPTLGILCSLILHEEITLLRVISILVVWCGVLIYLRGTRKAV